ncbi:serine/threonine-protein kinase [Streptomyces sp. DSM 44917]|uniref:Serine/threonine-protein kinase n=1 Tax=Streptomyces boetiae TaxID=3075541 RepID=A0ABU2LC67_9ACTN|nr:serine/threonine-protein kinase [Streptomyces sp. DSM 44917]MDT0308902.1 serine/threonine-protein kinase [Streptomyces sp. DSM 44917]
MTTDNRGDRGEGGPAAGPGDREPERLGGYVLERRLGAGGMGVVYLASTVAGRRLAVKVIRREYAQDPGFRKRFRREVEAARRVSGAFTAPVVDADPDGDPPWLATLYVPGGSLTDRVDGQGPLGAREAARIGAQLAEALQDIHRCGLVHRDLKPGNVLLAEDGVRVIDFGISRAITASHRLTEAGAVLGSPPFMAPEQLTGKGDVGTASDVFALGAVVAFAATGHSPFEAGGPPGGDPLAVAYRVVHEDPELGDVPEPLRDLVSLCLAKEPERRPEVSALLEMAAWADTRAQAAVIRDSPVWRAPGAAEDREARTAPEAPAPRGRRRRLAALAAVAVACAAAAGLWLTGLPGDGEEGPRAPADANGPADPSSDSPGPWERSLRDFGVRDAVTEGFVCAAAEGGLLCSVGGTSAVLLGPDGSELLRHDGPRDALGGPAALPGERALFARSERGLAALDPEGEGGEPLWEIDAPELMGELQRVRGTLMLQNGDSTLRFYAMDGPDRVGEWSAPGRYITDTVTSGAYVLAESRSEEFTTDWQAILLDADGREIWGEPVTAPDSALGTLEAIGMDRNAAYYHEFDPDLPVVTAIQRLDLATGEWTRTALPRPTEPRATVAGGVVYTADGAGQLTAVDAAAGTVLWSEPTGADVPSDPAVADGLLYLSDAEGRLYEIATRDGTLRRTGEPHPGTPGMGSDAWSPAPVIADGTAYVVTVGNTLYATPLSALRPAE